MASVLVGLVLGALVAAGNLWMLGGGGEASLRLAWFAAAPIVAAVVTAVVTRRRSGVPAEVRRVETAPPAPVEPPEHAALRLLAVLQEEGRLIDFLQEDIAPYSDQQVGAATRGIHESCAKALRSCVTLEPVMPGREDEPVTVPAGFDPSAVRLVGNVQGTPPFQGTLRHAGWRATRVAIPERKGLDPRIVAPAEVEIG